VTVPAAGYTVVPRRLARIERSALLPEDFGPERDMLPSELAIQRAREILEMLRSRAGEQDLPRIEKDYIERLLRGLY
jgi:hypothetical protein